MIIHVGDSPTTTELLDQERVIFQLDTVNGDGLQKLDDFIETVIKPELENKHGMKFQKPYENFVEKISGGITKYGIASVKDVSVEIVTPTDKIEDEIDVVTLLVNCIIEPRRKVLDSGAVGNKELKITLGIKKRKVGGDVKEGVEKKLLLSCRNRIIGISAARAASTQGVAESQERARSRMAHALQFPFRGGLPGLGGKR